MSFIDDYILYSTDVSVCPTSNGNPLIWRNDLGLGYLRSNGYIYAEDYWDKYHAYDNNGIGWKLTYFREAFVAKHMPNFDKVCDVGIGSGQFIKHVGAKGYDINYYAQKWLRESNHFGNPYEEQFEALTFWDVLEHLEDPTAILANTNNVFMSVPIHGTVRECMASKHLRPNEHIWHFTPKGVEFFMKYYGFELVDSSDGETKAGRESIMSYYFRRPINTTV
jgi:hypothetical protein